MVRARNQVVELLRSTYWHWRFTGDCYGCYRGIYETVEAAIAAAPKAKKIGYDHADLAKDYQKGLSRTIGFYDYPMLFWLKGLLEENATVFDFGGNVGTHFYSYENYITYPHHLKWIVCDLPAINQAGAELAVQEQRSELTFTETLAAAEGSDVLIASGSIQYLPSTASPLEGLAKLQKKPQHLLMGRLPLCEGPPFVTLQNGGIVFYPVTVRNKQQFIHSITALGYELVDNWVDRSEPCSVPFHPEFSSLAFNGFYFKLVSSSL